MAIHTIGTNATTSLLALPAWSQILAAADVAAIASSIITDDAFVSNVKTGAVGPDAVIATGNTHGNVTLDTLVAASGSNLAQIHPGDIVLGPDIPAGAYVAAVAGAVVTLSAAATATTVGGHYAFARQPARRNQLTMFGSMLEIPGGRGRVKVKPGDYVVLDPVTGWPILLSGNEVSVAGSLWTFT